MSGDIDDPDNAPYPGQAWRWKQRAGGDDRTLRAVLRDHGSRRDPTVHDPADHCKRCDARAWDARVEAVSGMPLRDGADPFKASGRAPGRGDASAARRPRRFQCGTPRRRSASRIPPSSATPKRVSSTSNSASAPSSVRRSLGCPGRCTLKARSSKP